MNVIRFVLVALLVFIVGTVVAFVYLEWWQALLVVLAMIVVMAVGLKFVIKSFIGNMGKAMVAMFEAKSRVLRGATAEVHSVEAAPVPPPRAVDQDDEDEDADDDDDDEGEGEEEEDETPRELAYYRIDVTIKPAADTDTPMSHWDVGDLCVVDFNAKPLKLDMSGDGEKNEADDPGEGFHFHDVQVMRDGTLHPDEDSKYAGEQRLNVLVGVPPELRELKFRYYTEQFGRIVLPPPYREPALSTSAAG